MFGEFMFLFIALAAIIILLDVWAIVSVYRSNKGVNSKALWSLLIALFPVVGLGIWGVFGPRGVAEPPSSPEHSKG
ncbi:PLD nuclease N-terminal domain-containing protein [Pseudomonas subflava]|uniref:PLD nuclease N-terminal domain-containing protein n=1 Tax=Pseudomonas subflava TaxID=2952933 RepID=UPI00207A87A3|nr:PLD nuclease N-terminal domain-containing protein [Pseudomonas subflava]